MKIILLSGGSGKRLWPLSNETRSKQFLKVLQNENSEQESMVQRIWRQLCSAGFNHPSYISTNKTQVDILQNQLGHKAPLIVEPEKRDTFPAIALASVYLFSVLNVKLDEVICVLPVDLYVEDSFFEQFEKMEASIEKSDASLLLVGVKPTYPSENYGYIIPDQNQQNAESTVPYFNISHFIEKPDPQTAQKLIKQNALWNCGVFAFRLGFMIQLLSEKKVPLQYKHLNERYSMLPQISFDYEVVEKAKHLVAIPYERTWNDLGTWSSLTNKMNSPVIGEGIITGQSNNTHLINELKIPVIINGISNSIVAISPDGILISNKSVSHQIKELVTSLHQRPMYEEKQWGSYRVLDYDKLENGNEVLTKRLKITAGENLSYQFHRKRQEIWTIISGEGELIINGQFSELKAGDVILIPQLAKHSARAISNLEFLEIQMGSELNEEDIVRIYVNWEEIEKNFRESG